MKPESAGLGLSHLLSSFQQSSANLFTNFLHNLSLASVLQTPFTRYFTAIYDEIRHNIFVNEHHRTNEGDSFGETFLMNCLRFDRALAGRAPYFSEMARINYASLQRALFFVQTMRASSKGTNRGQSDLEKRIVNLMFSERYEIGQRVKWMAELATTDVLEVKKASGQMVSSINQLYADRIVPSYQSVENDLLEHWQTNHPSGPIDFAKIRQAL